MLVRILCFLIILVICLDQSYSINRRCLQPLKQGKGKALLRNWFYNSTSTSCQRFIFYGGSKNGNNFETQSRCRQVCLGQKSVSLRYKRKYSNIQRLRRG